MGEKVCGRLGGHDGMYGYLLEGARHRGRNAEIGTSRGGEEEKRIQGRKEH